MNVLILITKSNWGGAQRYVYDLATNLPKDQFKVEVMAGGNGPLIDRLKQAGIQADGNLPLGRDVSITKDIKAFFELISLLRKKKPQILHVNSSKIGGLGALAGRLTGVPKIIFTAHGWAWNEDRSFFTKILIKMSYWVMLWLSHKTIAVSQNVKDQVRNWPYVYDKIVVVHNGIKTEALFSRIHARAELIKISPQFGELLSLHPAKDTVIIGSMGELHPIKGYAFALNGLRNLIETYKTKYPSKKVLYAICGEGQERKNLTELIAHLGLESHVVLLGHITDSFQYVRAFDVFLVPSLSEGLPYMLLEAGLAGMPTVATAVGGIPEIIDDMKSGILIQPRKAREIAHGLDFFISHKKVQKEQGEAFHAKIIKEFSLEKMVRETLEVYLTEVR
ncbi:MAG: glycosyltransferase [Patescibacteria group bacterium]